MGRGPLPRAAGRGAITAHVNLIGCRLERNRCFTSGVDGARPRGGGALFEINTGIIRIESCEFLHNTSDLSSDGLGSGSALVVSLPPECLGSPCSSCYECTESCVYGSGTLPCTSMACEACPTHVFVIGSVFAGNGSRGAGAAIKMNRKALFQDCAIAWNVREGPCLIHASAGVLVGHKSHSELSNCILFDNQDLSACGWSSLQEQISEDPGTGLSGSYAFQYSDVEGLCVSPCSPASGNLSAPPQFAATPDAGMDNQWGTYDDVFGDYTLTSGSPCADAGSDALLPPDDPFDLDRDGVFIEPLPVDVSYLTRRKEAGVGAVDQRVDMGAHELGCREDFNGDQAIDGTDLAFILGAWTGADAHYLPCPSFVQEDLDRNCRVDGFDLSLLLSAWGLCGVSGPSGGGGGGGEAATSGGSAQESGCEGEYELFLQWVESGDWDAFLQWHQCYMQLSGGS